ncbi:MAG: ATPase associated with various cellular 5 [Myxococcales bacterium]|nr:ATPase associated with various cellular 5 [Myxococcales bacterium]
MRESPPPPPAALPLDARLATRFQEAARVMEQHFLDKQEVIRLLLVSVAAGEHMLLVGPPGTAKSAIVRTFAKLIDAQYFEYLLTRFTEPNELFGPVDIRAFREGTYTRKTETMLPSAEIVFLDEIFKSNSAILNSLLTILNERKFSNGSKLLDVPLLSMFGASNEVPNDDNLAAIFDRFLLRVVSDNLDSYHFHNLIAKGIANEAALLTGKAPVERALFAARDLHQLHRRFDKHLAFTEDFLSKYKGLIFQIRSEGISVSDRRVVKLLKLFAASAIVDGRDQANDSDFFILKHIWNNLDQTEILEEIVGPVVDRWYRDHPSERRFTSGQVGLDDLLGELQIIRELLTSGEALSDIQLFSQLKNLNEIKAALQAVDSETARRMVAEVDALLENVFASSKFG